MFVGKILLKKKHFWFLNFILFFTTCFNPNRVLFRRNENWIFFYQLLRENRSLKSKNGLNWPKLESLFILFNHQKKMARMETPVSMFVYQSSLRQISLFTHWAREIRRAAMKTNKNNLSLLHFSWKFFFKIFEQPCNEILNKGETQKNTITRWRCWLILNWYKKSNIKYKTIGFNFKC